MRSIKIMLWGVAASLFIFSCENDGDMQNSGELSPYAKNFLTMKMGSMSSNSMASPTGFTNAANESFNRISGQTDVSFGRVREDSTKTGEDSTYYPSPWISCAQITTIQNNDNSVTTIYDYGDGCDEGNEYFKYLMYGKYTYTYLYENSKTGSVYKDHYFGSYTSENYGGKYYYENDTSEWTSNGSSTYSGTSEYDTAQQTYKGSYEYDGDDVYSYNGITYSYSGKGKGSYNEKGSVIELNDYSYSTADYSYETHVLEPLISKYDCYANVDQGSADFARCFMPVYVSGKEFVKYKQGDQEGSFEIDYGNGECDSKVVITENGNRIEVDLYQDFYSLN